MRTPPTHSQAEKDFNALAESYHIEVENDWLGFDPLDNYASKILDAKYDKVNVEDVAAAQSHLTPTQRSDLAKLSKKRLKQFMPDIILCQEYIKILSKRSLNTW